MPVQKPTNAAFIAQRRTVSSGIRSGDGVGTDSAGITVSLGGWMAAARYASAPASVSIDRPEPPALPVQMVRDASGTRQSAQADFVSSLRRIHSLCMGIRLPWLDPQLRNGGAPAHRPPSCTGQEILRSAPRIQTGTGPAAPPSGKQAKSDETHPQNPLPPPPPLPPPLEPPPPEPDELGLDDIVLPAELDSVLIREVKLDARKFPYPLPLYHCGGSR